MIQWLFFAGALFFTSPADAQAVMCPTRPLGDSTNACASTEFVQLNAGGGGGGGVTLNANSVYGNATAGSAAGTSLAMPSCSAASSALTWTTSSGFGCNSITASVGPGSVDTAAIVDGAVTTAKIADGAVTTVKLADGSVTTIKIADGNVTTAKIANAAVTPAKLSQPFTQMSTISASGTALNFTSIPSWVRKITIGLSAVSFSGSDSLRIRIGTGGVAKTSGYSSSGWVTAALASNGNTSTAGFDGAFDGTASNERNGVFTLVCVDPSTHTWSLSGTYQASGSGSGFGLNGTVTLAGALNIVTIAGTSGGAFDGGKAVVQYE